MADPAPVVAALGVAECFAVHSRTSAKAYLVARTPDGWYCSCPANHRRLKELGKLCAPVLAAKGTLPPGAHFKYERGLQLVPRFA